MKKITSVTFICFLVSILFLQILVPDQVISSTERRELQKIPDFSLGSLKDGSFMVDFEKYLLDQFAFREKFRSIKSIVETQVFHKEDVNGYFEYQDHITKLNYPDNPEMIDAFLNYITKIQDMYFKGNLVYFAMVPDKNYYMDTLKLDYSMMKEHLSQLDLTTIDLEESLFLNSYYKTDPHWRQEKLEGVIKKLAGEMNFDFDMSEFKLESYNAFLGAYYGQYSQKMLAEDLYFLSHHDFESLYIKNFEKVTEEFNVYDQEKLDGFDPYSMFLCGASPLLSIKNLKSKSDKELIVFRDSFASSLVPLLIPSYREITMVDTRYMSYQSLEHFIDIKDQDILFLYSSLVINNSVMLK